MSTSTQNKGPSTHLLLSKARARFRRKLAEAEEDEAVGELNLIPFLDVLVNTMIFLLATAAVAAPRANILATAPTTTPDDEVVRPGPPGDRLNLTVAVSRSGFIVGGASGILSAPDGTRPTIKCAAPLRDGRCPAFVTTRKGHPGWVDRYDYDALARLAQKIKVRYPKTRQAVLTADGHVPYQVLVKTLDAVRGKPTRACTGSDGCLFDRVSFAGGVK